MSATAVLASRADTPTRRAPVEQLQQRPAARDVEAVEPRLQPRPQIVAADQRQLGDDVGEAGRRRASPRATCRPSPLRGDAGVGAGRGHARPRPARWSRRCRRRSRATGGTAPGPCAAPSCRMSVRRERKRERQAVGQGRQRPAAVGIGRGAEIVRASAAAWRCGSGCRSAGRAVRRRPSFALVVLVADQRQRPAALAHQADLMHQRVLAPVRDPDLLGVRSRRWSGSARASRSGRR